MLTIGLIIIYYRLLYRVFNLLLSYFSTTLKDALVKDITLSPKFLYKALRLSLAISIPKDSYRIGSTRALQLREDLPDITISDSDATITKSGKIQLR